MRTRIWILFCWRQFERSSGVGPRVTLCSCTASAPTVARPRLPRLYGARRKGISIEQALCDVQAALPGSNPNAAFRAALARLASVGPATGPDQRIGRL